jgi:hypothetical protein
MPKKSTDPFMGGLWEALIADKLGPGGNETSWDETPVRIRNRFIKAVRQVLQSGAAFAASTMEVRASEPRKAAKTGARGGKKTARGKRRDENELQLPLMASVQAAAKKRAR